MIRYLIIDDEPLARSIVKEYLQPYNDFELLQECNDGFEGVKAIQHHNPDLIFLDIQMPKITGFEMLELIEKLPAIIFTTAFDEYAIKAFDSNAIDYLLKPFSKERFDKAIQKWQLQKENTKQVESSREVFKNLLPQNVEQFRVVVKTGNQIRIISISEISYIEACDDYVKIHTEAEVFMKKKTMSYYESVLNEKEFVRVHRSYIINLSQIKRIELMEKESYCALLKSGVKIPLSKSGYTRLKDVLGI